MDIVRLFFKDKEFIEQPELKVLGTELACLEIHHDTKEAFLTFSFEISFIDRKIAERLAESICKTGFLLNNGERIGLGFNLVVK